MKQYLLFLILTARLIAAVRDETSSIGDTTNNDMLFPKSLHSVQAAFNVSKEDQNVKVHRYDPRLTYKARLRTNMETLFILPRDEKIISYSIGDSLIFNYKPIIAKGYATYNLFTISPIAAGADTNLIVVGSSGRIYKFYLRSDNHESAYMPHFAIYITLDGSILELGDLLINEETIGEPKRGVIHFVSGNVNLNDANFGYAALKGGDKTLTPETVFDDGRFTYFRFPLKKGEARKLPVIYRVSDGYDTPVNSRIEGDYLIAETISDRWTLRAGEARLCIGRSE